MEKEVAVFEINHKVPQGLSPLPYYDCTHPSLRLISYASATHSISPPPQTPHTEGLTYLNV